MKTRGFTLIELAITVAVVGILAAIAIPSFQNAQRKTNRSAAEAVLMDVAQRQQQYLLDNRAYAPDLASLNIIPPAQVLKFYTFAIVAPPGAPPSFTATATPAAGTQQVPDGAVAIDQAGRKTPPDKW
jgi:type IV pilus assembly protein PilE